jgi:hypothetical protein
MIYLLLLLSVLPVSAKEKKKKTEPPPQETFPTSRSFAKPCDQVWPAAVASLMDTDMQILSSDRQGGVITFKGAKEYAVESVNAGFRDNPSPTEKLFRSLSIGHPAAIAYGYRIESGTFAAIGGNEGCTCQILLQYVGLFGTGYRRPMLAVPLRTSGRLESGLLNKIEAKFPE